jgi:hypothetical protein
MVAKLYMSDIKIFYGVNKLQMPSKESYTRQLNVAQRDLFLFEKILHKETQLPAN